MATIMDQLNAKIARGPRPDTLRRDPSLGQIPDTEAIHEAEEAAKLAKKVKAMRDSGERVIYTAELD